MPAPSLMDSTLRRAIRSVPSAAPSRVDVWRLDLRQLADRCGSKLIGCLTAEEEAQAGRYLRAATGWQFRLTRGALRHILSEYVGAAPKDLPIVRLPMGKPVLPPENGWSKLSFNVSHTAEFAAVAVAVGREVGIDVETRNRTLDVLGMAERFFAPEEAEELNATAECGRLEAFLRFWSRKEALLKGQGRGLSQDWTDVRVGSLRQSPVTIPAADLSVLWQLHDLDFESHHVGAVAVAGTEPFQLRWRDAEQLT